jgi:hypothetical protein
VSHLLVNFEFATLGCDDGCVRWLWAMVVGDRLNSLRKQLKFRSYLIYMALKLRSLSFYTHLPNTRELKPYSYCPQPKKSGLIKSSLGGIKQAERSKPLRCKAQKKFQNFPPKRLTTLGRVGTLIKRRKGSGSQRNAPPPKR